MDERSVRHILLARYYLHLAADQLGSEAEAAKFAAINLFHEALETTLVTCADHLNAKVPERSPIEAYLDRINQKLDGQELPFRSRILQFNKARVAAKHHLTLPESSFLTLIGTVVPEFMQTAVRITFSKDLQEISLVDLIEDEEVAGHIRQAEAQRAAGDFYECLTSTRKAFYVQFERHYDIRKFSNLEEAKFRGLFSAFSSCRAPFHAKNPEYIQDRVTRPSDFIVFDHSALDAELMKEGLDVQTFWNIWRLTPEIYLHEDGRWTVEYDFDLADDPQIRENCTYVLDNLISITLQRQARRKRSRSRSGAYRYIQTVPNAPFFKKALNGSEETGRLPDGVRRVNINKAVPALDGEGYYWDASYMRKDGPWLFGYVRADDTEGEPQFGFVADGTDIATAIPGAISNEPLDSSNPKEADSPTNLP